MSATHLDRVEAACRAYWGGSLPSKADWRRNAMSRALAAADAIVPPPVPEEVRLAYCEAATAMRRLEQVLDDERIVTHELGAEVERLTRERDEALKAVALGKTVITKQCAEIDRLEAARQSCARDAQAAERERDVLRKLYKDAQKTAVAAYCKAVDRAEAAERERDEMRAEVEALRRSEDEWASKTEVAQSYADTLIGAKNRLQARAEAAESLLARARADALEEAAKIAEQQVETYNEGMSARDVRLSYTRGPRWVDGPAIARAIRSLADSEPAGLPPAPRVLAGRRPDTGDDYRPSD